MISIRTTLSEDLASRAQNYSVFREHCKEYLANNGLNFDKFTVTVNDSFLGYVSEELFAKFLKNRYGEKISVSKWQDQFDMHRIIDIVKTGRNNQEDIDLVRQYFYDQFDLYVSAPGFHSFVNLKIDVKTAITPKKPRPDWDFLYPVVQAQKLGKDIAVLVYCIVENDGDPNSLKEFIIVGYLREDEIVGREIIHEGERTKHFTPSRTENYITYIQDYHDINELFNDIDSI